MTTARQPYQDEPQTFSPRERHLWGLARRLFGMHTDLEDDAVPVNLRVE